MKNVIIAATVATLALGAYTLPAFALADDYGQFVYTDQSQSRFAPEGQAISSGEYRATIDFGSTQSVAAPKTSSLFDTIDREHKAW